MDVMLKTRSSNKRAGASHAPENRGLALRLHSVLPPLILEPPLLFFAYIFSSHSKPH